MVPSHLKVRGSCFLSKKGATRQEERSSSTIGLADGGYPKIRLALLRYWPYLALRAAQHFRAARR